MALPNFLVIGAMKSASTSLCRHLEKHPEVFISSPKEPDFFSVNTQYERGTQWYESLFRGGRDSNARGEGSVTYSICGQYPLTVTRIAKMIPSCRLIYIVRHPLRRMESEYRQRLRWGRWVGSSFAETVDRFPLVETSLYWKQLSAYREQFADEQILILFFEDFVSDSDSCLRLAFAHIGVEPNISLPNTNTAHNDAASWRRHTLTSRFVKSICDASGLRQHIPSKIRSFSKHALTRPTIPSSTQDIKWPPLLLDSTISSISDDMDCFLAFTGRPGFWDLTKEKK